MEGRKKKIFKKRIRKQIQNDFIKIYRYFNIKSKKKKKTSRFYSIAPTSSSSSSPSQFVKEKSDKNIPEKKREKWQKEKVLIFIKMKLLFRLSAEETKVLPPPPSASQFNFKNFEIRYFTNECNVARSNCR